MRMCMPGQVHGSVAVWEYLCRCEWALLCVGVGMWMCLHALAGIYVAPCMGVRAHGCVYARVNDGE